MDNVVAHATHIIDQQLASPDYTYTSHISKSLLTDIRTLLHQLLQPDLPKNNWTRLFARQLERLLNQRYSLTDDFWIQLHDDILYTLEKSNGEQTKNDSWRRFLEKMNFESELENRQLRFNQTFGKRKPLYQLIDENQEFFKTYFKKCISFHSKMEVRGLIENIDDFLRNNFQQTKVSFTTNNKKLNCIEIPYTSSNKMLNSVDSSSLVSNKPSTIGSANLNNFLPSLEQIKIDAHRHPREIANILRENRWVVILGDPGSAKTTLLRWITYTFAENAAADFEEIGFEMNGSVFIRIPILIRIGEFAEWLVQHQTKTLIDYIGQHTWFSQRYCHDDEDYHVLKELIYHGHALILLDGLDEISEVGQRKKIVELVRKFIDEYVRTPDFISPFDERMFTTKLSWNCGAMRTDQSDTNDGNQIIITSRIVGYQLCPLTSSFVEHYTLPLMNHEETKKFIKTWMTCVEKSVFDTLSMEGIELDNEAIQNFSMIRMNAIESMFGSGAELLLSSPLLLTLICTFLFQSPDEFRPKSGIEIYDHVVQVALNSWERQQSNISKSLLIDVLIDLAMYLHLRSSSGLIDGFDMKQLCCMTLQRQSPSNNRMMLRKHAEELISLLNNNIGIFAERSLEVFGFLHLSFQEYFVAQSFVKGTSIESIVNRILSFIINPRFRQSLLLTIGYISWKWSLDDYENFCQLFFIPIKDYIFPFGAILFFDAFNDLYRLPSNSAICIALNTLLDHPSNMMAPTYLMLNLSKLDQNLIRQWIEVYVIDNKKRLLKFCECLSVSFNGQYRKTSSYENLVIPIIIQKLQILYLTDESNEFVIDQFLRGLEKVDIPFDDAFNQQNLSLTNIHPSIVSVIVAVCGGICFRSADQNTMRIDFSLEQINRQSSILVPILDYLKNTKVQHSIKVQTLIKQYSNILEKSFPTDTSLNIIDTFIALICLQGVSQSLFYQKYCDYRALLLAIDRLKRTWFYFKKFYKNKTNLKNEVESIMNVFFSQSDESVEQHISFSLACAAAWKKFGFNDTSDWLKFQILRTKNLSQYLNFQPEFVNLTSRLNSNQISQNILPLQLIDQKKLIFLLTFIPQSLQQLYYCMTIVPTNITNSLPLVVLLLQSLLLLESLSEIDADLEQGLLLLQPLFEEYKLENYASVRLGEQLISKLYHNIEFKGVFKTNDNPMLSKLMLLDQPIHWENLISMERQRIDYAKNTIQNSESDLQLFASSISLARIFQGQYRFQDSGKIRNTNLSSDIGAEIRSAVENIHDSVLQILALSIILEMKNPLIFNSEQEEHLQRKMIHQLEYLLPNLSLLKSTLLFIRCYAAYPSFLTSFKLFANIIGEKLIRTSINEQNENKEAAFLALQQLNNPDLFSYLSEFVKQSKNIHHLFQFNSDVFYKYFTDTIEFNSSSNSIILSSMYLAELAFDIQILYMYYSNKPKNQIPSLFEFQRLWGDSWTSSYIMTFEVATWITNYLAILDRADVCSIIVHIKTCKMIERKALSVIHNWLDYEINNKDWRFLRHFAALQLVLEGSNTPQLINIINEILTTDKNYDLRDIVRQLFLSPLTDITILHQILVNMNYSSNISVWIDRKEIFELFLNFELQRIISNERQSQCYLSIIKGYSKDLQIYLLKYLQLFVDPKTEIETMIKDKFLSIMIKWIINNSVSFENKQILSIEFYEFIFTLLNKSQFPAVQKAIFGGLNSLFIFLKPIEENISFQNIALPHLIQSLYSYETYSEDILSIFLLAFGNYFLKSNECGRIKDVTNDILNLLTHLFERSSSEIVSVRAGFCLIFREYSDVTSDIIQNWFRNRLNLNSEKQYQILMQQNLYNNKNTFDYECRNIVDHIRTYSTEIMEKFVSEFYNYLCKEHRNNQFSVAIPNFINIAMNLIEEDPDIFQNAVQNSSFGEESFRNALYCCFSLSVNERDQTQLITLYAQFGTVTMQLVQMLESSKDSFGDDTWKYFNSIKEVSDPEVIEKLFQILDLMLINVEFKRFSFILRLLIQLAHVHVVSLFEVHQHISNVIENLSSDLDYIDRLDQNHIFEYLLNLSCAKEAHASLSKIKLITEKDINKEFDNELYYINKKSILSLKRNYFLKEFHTIVKN